ncbi:MAG: hypothetical protein OEM66_00530 [Acidimicrobiia bacterium]|nr:hypothetical protein [Acidimicrobiia bacterium]
MTARPAVAPGQAARLRVLAGKRIRRPVLSPWMVFSAVVVVAILGLVIARTSLDSGAYDLARLERDIAIAQAHNTRLRLEIATLESPERIGPKALEMGLTYPSERITVFVDGSSGPDGVPDPRWAGIERYALVQTP